MRVRFRFRVRVRVRGIDARVPALPPACPEHKPHPNLNPIPKPNLNVERN